MPATDVKLNPRQRRFAELVATGIAPSKAYEEAGYEARGVVASAGASRMLKDATVSALINELRSKANAESEESAILTIREKRRFLARVVRTPIGEVNRTSDLCQEHSLTQGEKSSSEKFKMPDKLRALELDAKLAGEFKDDGESGGSTVTIIINPANLVALQAGYKQFQGATNGRN